ncbi:response regulator transcription factor [Lysinibacillus pakistanensis]|uniref:Response regulator transcription factor n=1 Tax=Lysinibacillus pakistanensis TaxID=759811 RepID=A0AAX3X2R4_9BACI|nr:response regulator transcription factor [Lysinibacillus pakistanensis]MDM5232479.1 response regulator transcription factor [Lysinibacillus pakistanensis]WHY47990.1 response regulator transcription factor [Lysinibacillus pakistanensis]WHY53002.1 response regulator transcription factor [Lysinibacillus pakistanensis]
MLKKAKVLIIEDEDDIATIIRDYLSVNHFEPYIVQTGQEAIQTIKNSPPDFIILDLSLPDYDGIELCRQIREDSNVALLILSARSSDTDKVLGLGFGADDYMTKPFSLSELVARIKAHLRKQDRWLLDNTEKVDLIQIDHMIINKNEYTFSLNQKHIPLSAKEFEMLYFLMKNRNQVFSKAQLLDVVWGYDTYGDENTITVYIRRLREKIEVNPSCPVYLQTVWGVGYKFSTQNYS